jgi:hypothetical protein
MVRTQVQLEEEQAAILKALAAERGISLAAVVRECVDEYVKRFRFVSPEERRQRALSIIGRFNSGLPDLGTEHDRYFVEAILDEDVR